MDFNLLAIWTHRKDFLIGKREYTFWTLFLDFGNKYYVFYLSKEIDTVLNPDYYSENDAVFIFNPYKEKKAGN